MAFDDVLTQQLLTLRAALQQTRQVIAQLDQQQAALTQQRDQTIQVLLRQQGAIQSAEEMQAKLTVTPETPALPALPASVDGAVAVAPA